MWNSLHDIISIIFQNHEFFHSIDCDSGAGANHWWDCWHPTAWTMAISPYFTAFQMNRSPTLHGSCGKSLTCLILAATIYFTIQKMKISSSQPLFWVSCNYPIGNRFKTHCSSLCHFFHQNIFFETTISGITQSACVKQAGAPAVTWKSLPFGTPCTLGFSLDYRKSGSKFSRGR